MAGIGLIGSNQADSTEQSNLALVLSRALPRKQILCRYQTNHLTEVLSRAFVSEGRRRQNLLSAFPATAAVTLSTTFFPALGEWELIYCPTQLMSWSLCFNTNRKGRQQAGLSATVRGPGQRFGKRKDQRWKRGTSLSGVQVAHLMYKCSKYLHNVLFCLFFCIG